VRRDVTSLMMGFTTDGQIEPGLVADRDRRFKVSSSELRGKRADIPDPGPAAPPAARR
jgi:hypothetical protein